MHRLLAILLALLVIVGSVAAVPAQALGAGVARVVIIVGPAGWATASYRTEAEAIATEARRWTSDVQTFYSPNATWEVVKPALQGASVVVYMGHGNGFPSPYSATPLPSQQNGLGLNPIAGNGDTTTKYYGEENLAAEVRLAPNAVVFLHHLCYASGNSEPGMAEPTIDIARQRVDNMAAGWSAAGARAVIADAHYGSAYYVGALFTTHQTLDALWRAAPYANGNVDPFPSVRTAGATGALDPSKVGAGYYRSFLGDPTLTTDAVLAAAGSVVAAPLAPPVPAAKPTPAPAGPVAASDTIPPVLSPIGAALSRTTFSPNGDGLADTVAVPLRLGEAGTLEVAVATDGGLPVRTWSIPAAAGRVTVTWDGRADGGSVVPDGRYVLSVTARDAAGNAAPSLAKPIAVYSALGGVRATVPTIWPTDPNGSSPAATDLIFTLASPASVTLAILDAGGRTVRTWFARTALDPGPWAVTWDGRDDGGALVAPGTYRLSVVASGDGLATRVTVPVGVGPFALTTSVVAATRGSSVTLTAVASELLALDPVVRVVQPGVAVRRLALTLVGDRWVVRIPVPRGGAAGSLVLSVTGVDRYGVAGTATIALPVR